MKTILKPYLVALLILLDLALVTFAQDTPVFREALYSGSLGSRAALRGIYRLHYVPLCSRDPDGPAGRRCLG